MHSTLRTERNAIEYFMRAKGSVQNSLTAQLLSVMAF